MVLFVKSVFWVSKLVPHTLRFLVILQVAKSIKIVMTSRSASVVVSLDMQTIQEAQLSLDANIVKESILRTPRIKIKPQVGNYLMMIF